MTGHYAEQVATYFGASTRKAYLARYHLGSFRTALKRVDSEGGFLSEPGPEDAFIEIDAHADGCVVQLYAALDAFSCAAAWHYQRTDADRYSFGQLAGSCPTELQAVVGAISRSPEYRELRGLRHAAGHRGLVAERRVLSVSGITVRTTEGEDVPPILERLVRWGGEAVSNLQRRAGELRWLGPEDTYWLEV